VIDPSDECRRMLKTVEKICYNCTSSVESDYFLLLSSLKKTYMLRILTTSEKNILVAVFKNF
jgi:hypothetical protein